MTTPWADREGQTLATIIEHFSQPDAEYLSTDSLETATGLDRAELVHRLRRLHDSNYIRADYRATDVAGVRNVLDKGWEIGAGQPTDQGIVVADVIGNLERAVAEETDPKRKRALQELLTGFRTFAVEFTPKLAAVVLSKVLKLD